MKPCLLITDLDNTLIGSDSSLAQLNEQLYRHRPLIKLVYATGRSPFLYQKLFRDKKLLQPDALITSVGTEMYLDGKILTHDADWETELAEGWDRNLILEIANQFNQAVLQPESEQRPFKVSYHLRSQLASDTVAELERSLREQRLDVKVIYSGGQDLDILPMKADKGLAANFLRSKAFADSTCTVVCGDSGNDIALFEMPEVSGIIVGNAHDELQNWCQKRQSSNIYFARAFYAAGILEGLEHFEVLTSPRKPLKI